MKKIEIKKLDKLWSKAIHARDINCQVCGATTTPNAHHVIGRRNHAVRWDLENGIILCSGCHTFRKESAHQSPLWFSEWFKENHPDRYENIMSKRLLTIKQPFDYWKEQLSTD